MPSGLPPGQEEDDGDPQYDVAVNVMKGKDGYGIYFTNKDGQIRVTKLDAGSEAERADPGVTAEKSKGETRRQTPRRRRRARKIQENRRR